MFDPRNRDASTDEACARLRNVLEQTRGLGRRDFLRVVAEAAAGSVLLSPLVAIAARTAQAAEQPVTYFTYGGAWKQAISAAFFDRRVHRHLRVGANLLHGFGVSYSVRMSVTTDSCLLYRTTNSQQTKPRRVS